MSTDLATNRAQVALGNLAFAHEYDTPQQRLFAAGAALAVGVLYDEVCAAMGGRTLDDAFMRYAKGCAPAVSGLVMTALDITRLTMAALLGGAVYAGACLFWPWTARGRCEGGQVPLPERQELRPCPRCGGSGRKERLGAVVLRKPATISPAQIDRSVPSPLSKMAG